MKTTESLEVPTVDLVVDAEFRHEGHQVHTTYNSIKISAIECLVSSITKIFELKRSIFSHKVFTHSFTFLFKCYSISAILNKCHLKKWNLRSARLIRFNKAAFILNTVGEVKIVRPTRKRWPAGAIGSHRSRCICIAVTKSTPSWTLSSLWKAEEWRAWASGPAGAARIKRQICVWRGSRTTGLTGTAGRKG